VNQYIYWMKKPPIKNKYFILVAIIIVLISAVVMYAATLCKVDYVTGYSIDSFKEQKRLAEIRHKKLSTLIAKKSEVKNRLDFRFKWAYHTLTFLGICIFFGSNTAVYLYHDLDISTILTWNTAVWIPFSVVNAVYFGSRITLKSALQYFKTALENKVYTKYVNINDQIDAHEKELSELENILKSDSAIIAQINS